jgi:lipopolysaccharide/colanic/teichoic acid biosynthesis glycosyltransferase
MFAGGPMNLAQNDSTYDFQVVPVPTLTDFGRGVSLRRATDVLVSFAVLAVLSPLLLLLGACAQLSTGGSAIFRQPRVGLGGATFFVAKFRTLVRHAPCDVHKGQAEHLATRIGRIMRRSKLDELPQLWNILRGDMSLIGPRPIIPEEYGSASHYARLSVRPGLTGLWQLSNARGERFDEHPEYDIFYLANRRLTFDLWLVWRTMLLIVVGAEIGFARTVERWERNPQWRALVPEAIASLENDGGQFQDSSTPGNHLFGERPALGLPLMASCLEAIPASAPSE